MPVSLIKLNQDQSVSSHPRGLHYIPHRSRILSTRISLTPNLSKHKAMVIVLFLILFQHSISSIFKVEFAHRGCWVLIEDFSSEPEKFTLALLERLSVRRLVEMEIHFRSGHQQTCHVSQNTARTLSCASTRNHSIFFIYINSFEWVSSASLFVRAPRWQRYSCWRVSQCQCVCDMWTSFAVLLESDRAATRTKRGYSKTSSWRTGGTAAGWGENSACQSSRYRCPGGRWRH